MLKKILIFFGGVWALGLLITIGNAVIETFVNTNTDSESEGYEMPEWASEYGINESNLSLFIENTPTEFASYIIENNESFSQEDFIRFFRVKDLNRDFDNNNEVSSEQRFADEIAKHINLVELLDFNHLEFIYYLNELYGYECSTFRLTCELETERIDFQNHTQKVVFNLDIDEPLINTLEVDYRFSDKCVPSTAECTTYYSASTRNFYFTFNQPILRDPDDTLRIPNDIFDVYKTWANVVDCSYCLDYLAE